MSHHVKFQIERSKIYAIDVMCFYVDGKRQSYYFLSNTHVTSCKIRDSRITVNYHLHAVVASTKTRNANVTLEIV